MAWPAWLIGSLIGLGKHAVVDVPKEQRQRELAAQTQLYSPWTGLQAQPVQEADAFGSALQGGTAGAMYSQMKEQNELAKQELDIHKDFMNHRMGKNANTPALGNSASLPASGSAQAPTLLTEEMQEFLRRKKQQQQSYSPWMGMQPY